MSDPLTDTSLLPHRTHVERLQDRLREALRREKLTRDAHAEAVRELDLVNLALLDADTDRDGTPAIRDQ